MAIDPVFNCFFIVEFKSYFYILDNSHLLAMSLTDIFFQSVTYLFILLTASFHREEHLILIKSNQKLFLSLVGIVSKKSSSNSRSPGLSPCYPLVVLQFYVLDSYP